MILHRSFEGNNIDSRSKDTRERGESEREFVDFSMLHGPNDQRGTSRSFFELVFKIYNDEPMSLTMENFSHLILNKKSTNMRNNGQPVTSDQKFGDKTLFGPLSQ